MICSLPTLKVLSLNILACGWQIHRTKIVLHVHNVLTCCKSSQLNYFYKFVCCIRKFSRRQDVQASDVPVVPKQKKFLKVCLVIMFCRVFDLHDIQKPSSVVLRNITNVI